MTGEETRMRDGIAEICYLALLEKYAKDEERDEAVTITSIARAAWEQASAFVEARPEDEGESDTGDDDGSEGDKAFDALLDDRDHLSDKVVALEAEMKEKDKERIHLLDLSNDLRNLLGIRLHEPIFGKVNELKGEVVALEANVNRMKAVVDIGADIAERNDEEHREKAEVLESALKGARQALDRERARHDKTSERLENAVRGKRGNHVANQLAMARSEITRLTTEMTKLRSENAQLMVENKRLIEQIAKP